MDNPVSERLFMEAKEVIPGGVNSPVRAFKAVGMNPIFIERGSGSRLYDADGREYIDYVQSWGPLILGHAHPSIVGAVGTAVEAGVTYGAPTAKETRLAKLIRQALPSVEKVRLVNSGTEATMSAIRLARGYTRRDRIVKFAGCYHGHVDSLLMQMGSGGATLGIPSSPGVPESLGKETVVLPYNDIDAVRETFKGMGNRIAAVIVEPVAGNMGVVPPRPMYLEGLREITEEYGALLIFDEVITGFRVSYGGAQGYYGVTPDLTCLGKIIGGGLPVGAFGGRAEIMDLLAPDGPVYQAGTLSGNPLAVSAGIACLGELKPKGPDADIYRELEDKAIRLTDGIRNIAESLGLGIRINRVASMFTIFFSDRPVVDYPSASSSDTGMYARFFRGMLERGFYFAPSAYEAAFVSTAHTREDLDSTIHAVGEVFGTLTDHHD